MTCILAYGINIIPGLHFRASEDAEVLGIDEVMVSIGRPDGASTELTEALLQHGETSYDFVYSNRDLENPQDFHDYSAKVASPGYHSNSHASSKEKVAHTSSHQPADTQA